MNRTELVESVVQDTGVDKKQADAAISAALSTIVSEIKSGNRVTIHGFGTFNPKSNAARMGRNPRTNEPMRLAASKGVSFKAATAFKSALQAKKAAAKKTAPAKKATATRKTTASKSTASKSTATKSTATKSTASRKAGATKSTATKKAPAAKKTTAGKTVAKKATAAKKR